MYIKDKEIKLPYPIVEVLTIDNYILLRIEPEIHSIFNRNIYCFDETGIQLWQIQESSDGSEDKPFMSMRISSKGELIVGNWNGIDYLVNMNDGSITPIEFRK